MPGSNVTLQGSDATFHFVSDADGSFRFLNLEPGRYTLDFEADVGTRVADPVAAMPVREVRAAPGELPRWVVVTPARVTTVNLTIEVEVKALSVAAMPARVLQH